jgi:hypothetical protein
MSLLTGKVSPHPSAGTARAQTMTRGGLSLNETLIGEVLQNNGYTYMVWAFKILTLISFNLTLTPNPTTPNPKLLTLTPYYLY